MKNRKNHHLLSTAVRPGFYNASHPNKSYLCGVESAIRSTQQFSKEERLTLQQKKLEEHLRTSTGIPKVDVDEYEKKKKEKHYFNTHSPLPPLKNKPQVDLFYTFEKIYVFFGSLCCLGKSWEKYSCFFF